MTQIPNDLDQRLGAAIRQRRVSKGYSQEALGAALGISFQMVQKYEKGRSQLTVVRLAEIANALGWSAFMLLTFALGERPIDSTDVSDRATLEVVKRFTRLKANERAGIVLLVRKLAEGL